MKINIYKSIYNFQETNTNFLENLESLNDDNYELLNDKELVSDSNELKLISKVYIRKKDKKLLDWQLLIKNVYLDTEEDDNLFSESGHHFDAILFLKEDTTLQNNVYIIPFGQAYHDINNLIDYDFGIDFAERAIKNEDIVNKNVNFFQQNRLKEIVNYRRNSVDYVRPSESYISVQGHPQNPQIFGKTMTCGTSISLRVPNRKQQFIDKISVIIKEINAIINLPQKISEFPRIVTLKDLNKIEVLDTLLLKKLSNSSTTENISIDISRFLELSNMILLLDDMLDVNIYINSFKNNTLETFDATDPEVDYITEIGDYLLKYDVNSINDVRIEVIDNLGHSNNMLLKTILHAEVEMEDGKKYLLQNGKWGYFNREFFDLLNDHLNEIEIRYNTLTPTGLVFKEGEEGYIKEIVGRLPEEYLMLHKKFIKPINKNFIVKGNGIELADLYNIKNKELFTIKRGINTSLSLYSLEQNIIAINALKYPESYNFEELIEAIPDNSENIFNDIQRSTNFSIVWILPISSIDNMPIKDMVHTSNVINKNFQLTNLGLVLLKNKLVEWSLYLKDQRINPIIYMETPTEDRN
ncbi:TPA: TIGR04141 family sporadically distributed protein [Staphylococcus aureus]|nr:TIGR04141 family sporadically distributed protein [Staphylococcus aureus]HDL9117588.1 TIGR04141 family sporadically distributed protein [Staphylococcus aureus]HDL9120556.1 TIGR04141 family sporadically distributed protein [Staphylococcus aureus]HDL9131309.1 TIGR04141 family sporadically distributed protein [Staphylococcus aureus]HDL9215443.1 TIGR04141 family sporadically distributed protein [Staphylococcus aureus]